MIAMLLAVALQAPASAPARLPRPAEGYELCLRNNPVPVDDDGTPEEWRAGWRATLARCRENRLSWWHYYFAGHRARYPTWSDAALANTVETLMMADEAEAHERYRHQPRMVCEAHCGGRPSLEGVGTVFFATLQDARGAPQAVDMLSQHYGSETHSAHLQYLVCFASSGWDLRNEGLAPEAVAGEAKARCRPIYDYFVEGVARDDGAALGAVAAAERARSFLDAMDARMIAAIQRERGRHPR